MNCPHSEEDKDLVADLTYLQEYADELKRAVLSGRRIDMAHVGFADRMQELATRVKGNLAKKLSES